MNRIIIATARNKHVRIYLADTKEMCEDARKTHNLYPTSLAALGRVMTVTSVMASMLKGEEETITTTINGGGPIGTVMASAKGNGEVKGFVGDNTIHMNYNDSGKLAVGVAIGRNGYLKVTKDLGLKSNFTSQVALQSGEIGDDFAYYFTVSEQVPSLVSVGVLVDVDYSCRAAGAFIVQLLPGHTEEDIVYLEEMQKRLRPISKMLDEKMTLEEILNDLFVDAEILEEKSVRYHCDCDRDRFIRGLFTLPLNELKELAEEDVEVKCEFCNKKYHFKKEEVKDWIQYVEHQTAAKN